MNEQDYDNDGNNIVPCPICLDVYCKSKDGGKCPREDEFIKSFEMNEHTKKANNKTALILIDIFGHSQKTVNATRKIREVIDEALKSQAEYIRAEMVPDKRETPEQTWSLNDDEKYNVGYNLCLLDIKSRLDELINSF